MSQRVCLLLQRKVEGQERLFVISAITQSLALLSSIMSKVSCN